MPDARRVAFVRACQQTALRMARELQAAGLLADEQAAGGLGTITDEDAQAVSASLTAADVTAFLGSVSAWGQLLRTTNLDTYDTLAASFRTTVATLIQANRNLYSVIYRMAR